MISVFVIASYALRISERAALPVNNWRLQDILYIAQGHSLRASGDALFPEHIYAWDEGPVVPEVFGKYKTYTDRLRPTDDKLPKISGDMMDIIRSVVEECGAFSDDELKALVCSTTPWIDAHDDGPNGIIRKAVINEYFSQHKEI